MAKSGASKGAKRININSGNTERDGVNAQMAQAKGTLGTLHWADKVGNTPAWQNRMGVNKKGERLYDFGADLIRKI